MKKSVKQIISILMSVIISASLFTFGASAEELVRSGDVNNDSQISAADARLTLRISAQLETANWLMRKHADVDGNDKITAGDARTILRVSASLEEESVLVEFDPTDIPADTIPYLDTSKYTLAMYENDMGRIDMSEIDTPDNFIWKSSDPEVASIDDNGIITAHKKGYTCIIAYYGEQLFSWDLKVRNELQRKIYSLENKYPGGYYWNNHEPSEEYPEVSEHPCTDHLAAPDPHHQFCKGQCAGFAALMFEEVHGFSMYSGKSKVRNGVTWDDVKIGDYIRLTGSTNHSIFITDIINPGDVLSYNPYTEEYYYAEEKMVIVVHCNWGVNCDITWDDMFPTTREINPEYCYSPV